MGLFNSGVSTILLSTVVLFCIVALLVLLRRYYLIQRRLEEVERRKSEVSTQERLAATFRGLEYEISGVVDRLARAAPRLNKGAVTHFYDKMYPLDYDPPTDAELVDRLLEDCKQAGISVAQVLEEVRDGFSPEKVRAIKRGGEESPQTIVARLLEGVILSAVRRALPQTYLPVARLCDLHYSNQPHQLPPAETYVAAFGKENSLSSEAQITAHAFGRRPIAGVQNALGFAAVSAGQQLSWTGPQGLPSLEKTPIRTTAVFSDGNVVSVVEVLIDSKDLKLSRTELVPLFPSPNDREAWTEAGIHKNGAGLIALNLLASCVRFDTWSRKRGWTTSVTVPAAGINDAAGDSLQLLGRGASADVYAVTAGAGAFAGSRLVVKVMREACRVSALQRANDTDEVLALRELAAVGRNRPCCHVPTLATAAGTGAVVPVSYRTTTGAVVKTSALLTTPVGTPLVQCLDEMRHWPPERLTLEVVRTFVAAVLLGVASAMEHAHAARLEHCDVRPSNIIVVGWNSGDAGTAGAGGGLCDTIVLVDWAITDAAAEGPRLAVFIPEKLRHVTEAIQYLMIPALPPASASTSTAQDAEHDRPPWPEATIRFLEGLKGRAWDASRSASSNRAFSDLQRAASFVQDVCGLDRTGMLQAAAASGCTCFDAVPELPASIAAAADAAASGPHLRQRRGASIDTHQAAKH